MRRLERILVLLLIVCLLVGNSVYTFAAPASKTATPSAPTLSYSPMTPTNGNVTVTVNYPTTAVTKQYRLGTTGNWIAYVGPITLTANSYVAARYQNSKGTWSTLGGKNISNIDKTTPSSPTFSVTPTTLTNLNVTVTIGFSSDSTIKQYKIGNSSSWSSYTTPIILTSNSIIYARAADAVGNYTASVSYSVNNIDRIAPSVPILTASTLLPTNNQVSVSMSFPTDAANKIYKIGINGTWLNYSTPVVLLDNEVIYAKGQDLAGNWSSEAILAISNIDKVAPLEPTFSLSNINATNQNVVVTIEYSSDSTLKQYRVGSSGLWTNYQEPLTISSNDSIAARSQDLAGNWSNEGIVLVTNIDKLAPISPQILLSETKPTNQDITVIIDYSTDSLNKEYRIGSSGTWTQYAIPFVVNANETIYAKAADEVGNGSVEVSYEITNIDKVIPANPSIIPSTTALTNQDVTLNITYSSDSVIRQYKVDFSGTWIDYTASLSVSTNSNIYSRGIDEAGNVSQEVSYFVNNIDTTGPTTPVIYPSSILTTSQPITITINYSDDSVVKQYKVGVNGTWLNYTGAVGISTNTTIYAKSADLLGNWSLDASYNVTNISKKIVLGYTVKYSSTDMSSYNSMVANVSTLSEIATATYSIDGLGNLSGIVPTDQINYANNNGIRPNLMVSNNFDATIAKTLLQNPENRLNLKNQILNYLKTYNYKGVDIDIENIPAICRNDFTTFMSEVYTVLKPLGYGVSVAVPAKVNDATTSTWNYAFDYKSLAGYSDYLMIMAYDEHYPGGTPGAVASINWVKSVVNYALTVVPKEKIVLGLAAYGYDWSAGVTKAYSINGCINLAKQYASTIYLDPTTQSKYFTYTVSGVAHTVWFEDGETIGYKLDLVNINDLKGIGIWRLGLENIGYWDTIKAKLNK